MTELMHARLAAECLKVLDQSGYDVEQCIIDAKCEERMRAMGKPYVTPSLSPTMNDFTAQSAFWLFLQLDGLDVAGVGVKYQDVAKENVAEFWERTISRQYPPSGKSTTVSVDIKDAISEFAGRLIYMGDLYVRDGQRGSRNTLTIFVRLLHLFAAM
mgnify:CR=1 FL=1